MLLDKVKHRWLRVYSRLGFEISNYMRGHTIVGGEKVVLLGRPIVRLVSGSQLTLGENVVLCSKSDMTALGVSHEVVIRTVRSGAHIDIGKHSGISGGSIVCAESITIGDECLIGANCTIVDTDFHPKTAAGRRFSRDHGGIAPVVIGRNVFLGAGSIVLKGTEIGADSVVGAGSVVSGKIPAGVIAAGNPCRVIRELDL